MSVAVRPTEPIKRVKPPREYPAWLKATFSDTNANVPASALDKDRPKIEYTQIVASGRVLGGEPNPRAKFVAPPMVVEQKSMVPIRFKVLSIHDRPITGFSIRANDDDLLTDSKGEAGTHVYPGHLFRWSTGRESGWTIPNGARRRLRMTGLVPLSQSFPVSEPTTVLVYPESGEFQIGQRVFKQPITYTTS